MQITIADGRGEEDFFGRRDLVDVAFDLELISPDGDEWGRVKGCLRQVSSYRPATKTSDADVPQTLVNAI
jgi:hypothetical protein